MSRRRQTVLFSRYSELPSRYTRRVTRTSYHSIPSSSAQSLNVSDTSANPTGLRVSAPLKMTSAISSPLSDFADCSPSAHRTASRTLDFPHPFGPTTAVMPSWKFRIVLSANDLKPSSSSDCKCILGQNLGPRQPQYSKLLGVTSEKNTIHRVPERSSHRILGVASLLSTPRNIEPAQPLARFSRLSP